MRARGCACVAPSVEIPELHKKVRKKVGTGIGMSSPVSRQRVKQSQRESHDVQLKILKSESFINFWMEEMEDAAGFVQVIDDVTSCLSNSQRANSNVPVSAILD